MAVDELKSMPKGHFIVIKTGCRTMKTWLKLFFKWRIQFEDAYSIEEKSDCKVQCADCREVKAAVPEMLPSKPSPLEFNEDFNNNFSIKSISERRTPKTGL